MTAVNSVASARLPLPTFSPRAVLMYSAAVGGEGAVALQLREATPTDLTDERLTIACHEPELLADLLHVASDIGGENDGIAALLNAPSPDVAFASDGSDSLSLPDPEPEPSTSSGLLNAEASTSAAGTSGEEAKPAKKVRPKPTSPNRQGPQQCQVCNKVFGNASALAKHKLTHSDERKYVCNMCAKAFKRQDHLNGHLLTHRNKKPYECKADGCNKSYCDARSLRRHTENHHSHIHLPTSEASTSSSPCVVTSSSIVNTTGKTLAIITSNERDPIRVPTTCRTTRGISPASPMDVIAPVSESSNCGSERSTNTSTSGSGSESSPPSTPPAPVTPTLPPMRKPKLTKTKSFTITIQHSHPKCSNTASTSVPSVASTSAGPSTSAVRTMDIKPVECNLCHRKFKNIPALNGHMRLHGGYFKKDSDSKNKTDKKETTGPPLQTASVSVRALIEEKIISRRGANAASVPPTGSTAVETFPPRTFATPAPPQLSHARAALNPPVSPVHTTSTFMPPRAPPVVNIANLHRDSTLIELLKKGNSKVVKRSASDPGQASPQQEYTFRPELFGVSFNSDDGYFSPALNEDTFQFGTAHENLDELALEDYATVAASIRERSPVTFPSSRRLAAVLNSPLPESLADFGVCHGGSPVQSSGMVYAANSPGLSYTTGDSPGIPYTATSPGAYSTHAAPSPGIAYPTPPASHDAQSPAHSIPRASSPLSAAFFTATMSSQEEVEEALEEVLPEECGSLDAYTLEPSPTSRRIMLNSEDPLLSSNPRDFTNMRPFRRQNRMLLTPNQSLHPWPETSDTLQVSLDGRDSIPAVFMSPSSVSASPQHRKRRASPAGPHRTRMRRNTAHYRPQPMLAPDRDGAGLFIDAVIPGLTIEPEPQPEAEDQQRPQINVGPDHQADIPELCNDRMDLHRATEQLLWDPGINDRLDDTEVRMFMELATCAAMPVGGHTREAALQTLGECGGDVRAATLRLMTRTPPPSAHDQRWAPDELEAFLVGLAHYDKDFYRIAQLIRTKDSKQCIQFYYFWKKVTKDYKTKFLRSWNSESTSTAVQGPSSQPPQSLPCTASPSSFDGEEYPCKICGKVFNKVKSRSAHMKSHRPLDADNKRPKHEKPSEKVERSDDRSQCRVDRATFNNHSHL